MVVRKPAACSPEVTGRGQQCANNRCQNFRPNTRATSRGGEWCWKMPSRLRCSRRSSTNLLQLAGEAESSGYVTLIVDDEDSLEAAMDLIRMSHRFFARKQPVLQTAH